MRPPSGDLERGWLHMQPPRRQKRACKKFSCPTHPTVARNHEREAAPSLQGRTWLCRAMQKQGSIVHPLRDLANCSKLRMANVGWAEFKPHLRGSLGHGPNQHKRAVPRRGHGAKSLTQHRHAGPSANSGSVDTVPEPSGCTPLSLSSCDHRQAALSASGCECSLPEMAMKTCNIKKEQVFSF